LKIPNLSSEVSNIHNFIHLANLPLSIQLPLKYHFLFFFLLINSSEFFVPEKGKFGGKFPLTIFQYSAPIFFAPSSFGASMMKSKQTFSHPLRCVPPK
jgi:hypothetical protein